MLGYVLQMVVMCFLIACNYPNGLVYLNQLYKIGFFVSFTKKRNVYARSHNKVNNFFFCIFATGFLIRIVFAVDNKVSIASFLTLKFIINYPIIY